MPYQEVHILIPQEFYEIVMAELAAAGYDSFMETEEGLYAYIEQNLFGEEELNRVLSKYFPDQAVSWSAREMENKNWNEEWEKNFEPVIISDQCIVRASFHKSEKAYPYDIVINPKMSFGTGHHETTHMMIAHQLQTDHKNKKVIDAGSGTGILAILAEKLGASEIMAYDIEDWAFENLKENINLNDCRRIKTGQGDIEKVIFPFTACDIVLANINKNVLLKEIPLYSRRLNKKGILIVSGFYEEDVPDIENVSSASSLIKLSQNENNRWASVVFQKI